ncbi:kinesin-like protein KIN-14N [Nicotiana sylvestris]|uniref:kinesin-like protein KIN-14N n=1 Tax=Nicotiana sylvestris TaxID=4096 RepID=UPI00388C9FBC
MKEQKEGTGSTKKGQRINKGYGCCLERNINEDSEDEAGDEHALMAIGESDDEQEVSILHLKDKIKFLSKERLCELLLDFIDEFEIINNEKQELSRECMILKAKCKNLESKVNESKSENAELKNQVLELDNSVLELRFENLKLKLGTGKKKGDHTHLTLEENLGKMKDELYRKDEKIKVLKEDLGKVKHELDRTCKWNKASDALSWLQEHHSSNKKGLGYGTQAPKWDPKSKYLTLPENTICTHCGKTVHYKK